VVVDDELYSFFSFPIFSDVSEKMEGNMLNMETKTSMRFMMY
jgi:hypothetical protein